MGRPFCAGVSMISQVSDLYWLIERCIGKKYTEFSFLDIGCGRGLYGYILRTIFGFNKKVAIHGVEIHLEPRYRMFIENMYDWVYIGDISIYLEKGPPHFDIALAQQVFEHLPKEDALWCMEHLKEHADNIIVGFPRPNEKKEYDQDPRKGFNAHRWGVDDETMKKIGYTRVETITNNHVYIWRKNNDLTILRRNR
jgi:hypothetical protein